MRLIHLSTLGIFTLASTSSFAITLEQARANGFVCEQEDGLLRNTSGRTDVDDLITKVNYQRLQEYQRIAKETKTSIQATQAIFGDKLKVHGQCPKK